MASFRGLISLECCCFTLNKKRWMKSTSWRPKPAQGPASVPQLPLVSFDSLRFHLETRKMTGSILALSRWSSVSSCNADAQVSDARGGSMVRETRGTRAARERANRLLFYVA